MKTKRPAAAPVALAPRTRITLCHLFEADATVDERFEIGQATAPGPAPHPA